MANRWRAATVDEIKDPGARPLAMGPFGSDITTDNFVPFGVPVIRGINLSVGRFHDTDFVFVTDDKADELLAANAFPGDLVFTHRGTLGQVGLIPPDARFPRYVVSQSQMKLSVDRGVIDPLFLYYFFKSPLGQHELLANTSTTGVPAISRPLSSLRAIQVPVPPMSEQRAIARILGMLDDKIRLNQRMNETLEAMARARFKSWFVDFDPVLAKVGGNEPSGMDAESAALFPSTFKDSEIGSIPQGWTVARMPEVFDINPPRPITKGTSAPYLEMANMPTSSARVLGWECRDVGSGMRFINGDTLVARITPCLENGKTAFVDFLREGESGWGSTEYIVLRSKPPLPLEYSYFLARSDDFRSHAIQNMTGTSGRQRVPAAAFDNYLVVTPSAEVGRIFAGFAGKVFAAMKAHDEESTTLVAMRDTLLPKLFSGKVRVAAAEQLVEAAV